MPLKKTSFATLWTQFHFLGQSPILESSNLIIQAAGVKHQVLMSLHQSFWGTRPIPFRYTCLFLHGFTNAPLKETWLSP